MGSTGRLLQELQVGLVHQVVLSLQVIQLLQEVPEVLDFHYLPDCLVCQVPRLGHCFLVLQVDQGSQRSLFLLCFLVVQELQIYQGCQVYQNCLGCQVDPVLQVGLGCQMVHCFLNCLSDQERQEVQVAQVAREVHVDICGIDHQEKLQLVGSFLASQGRLLHHWVLVLPLDHYPQVVREAQLGKDCYCHIGIGC